ncbi:AsnC family transcriptional regulator [Mucilaginibacter pallidiroseus]
MVQLDEVDFKLLKILTNDSSQTIKKVAEQVNSVTSPVVQSVIR